MSTMRGDDSKQPSMFCVIQVEERIPQNHPLREIKKIADKALARLSRRLDGMYSRRGRPSIAPEKLLKGMVLMALYRIRSEIQLCEQLEYNMLFRWFLDIDLNDKIFDHCAFSDNRERMMKHDMGAIFFGEVVQAAQEANLMSNEHFSVDGTLLEAWASTKSFRAKDNDDDEDSNSWSGFKGKTRSNETHESKTDPQAKLYRKGKGKEAKLCFMAHGLMENRNGLLADFRVSEANGTAEREAALEMLRKQRKAKTAGFDAGYNTKSFVKECRALKITPHVAGKKYSAVDKRTTGTRGYAISQRIRKRVEQIMGWTKIEGGLRKTRFKGLEKNQTFGYIAAAAYNLVRMSKLLVHPV